MCRHLAYLGPPVPVGELLTRGPHSLRTQSWAPRDMRGGGTINADGFGVAWWHHPDAASPDHGPGVIWHGGATPDIRASADAAETDSTAGDLVVSRYRNAAPIWTDPAVDEVLPQIRSTAVLAAIRSATVGMPVERAACAPFTHGRWAFSHNGAIPDWRRVLAEVAAEFGSPSLLEAESLTDSAALWVILRGLLDATTAPPSQSAGRSDAEGAESRSFGAAVAFGSSVSVTSTSGAPPDVRAWGWATTAEGTDARASSSAATARAGEPGEALRLVMAAVLRRSPKARLNLLVGDGVGIWATTWHHSLSVLAADGFVVVASEPFDDDPRWRPIGDRQLVRVRGGRVSVEPLDIEIGRAGS
ncbi:ergothioneine biosynthesis protein EgtC [Nocardia sp. CDC160]|uniref:ergothioneine biosynthesis protein EgtC n=1 Tax=Nocardia sp. CDC160 TaxID=3112166 RepID=UPI003FA3AEE9